MAHARQLPLRCSAPPLLLRPARARPNGAPMLARQLSSNSGRPLPPGGAGGADEPPRSPSQPSFQGQLMGGIQQRLAREKEEMARVADELARARPRSRWGVTLIAVAFTLAGYYMGTHYPRELDGSSTAPLGDTRPPRHDVRKENLRAAWDHLVSIVGRDNVSMLESDLELHSRPTWMPYKTSYDNGPEYRHFCIVYPASTEEVAAVMKACHSRRIPVTAYSGGTSIEGSYVPTRGGICIDFGRMDRVVAVHPDDLDVVVQPAVRWDELNASLAGHGLFFPPDPGPGAMIGGMVGTGCSGTNAGRWGTMREWVLGLTVVLADGTVIQTRRRPRKSSAGYDLTRLFVGSEGTLGLVTEATLKLAVAPRHSTVAVVSFPTVRAAAACAADVVARGVPVAAVELLDDAQMRCINAAGSTTRTWAEAPTLFFKFGAPTEAGVREQIDAVAAAAKLAGASTLEFAKKAKGGGGKGDDEAAELWAARKDALWSATAVGTKLGLDRVFTGDVAVPVSRMADLIGETREALDKSGLFGSMIGHVGDGNFHLLLMYADTDAERKKADALVRRMVERVVEMDGTVSGEHGVGLVKRDYLPLELGQSTVDAMRRIKQALDPLCLLNCDKVIRMEKPGRGGL